MVLRFLLLSAGLWRSISAFWGCLNANITFSRRMHGGGWERAPLLPSPAFPADLHAVRAGRRQLVVARCHAKLWPLSVRSHQASRAWARSKGRFPARLGLQRGMLCCKCAKTARKQQVSVESRTPVFGSVWPSSFLPAPSSCPHSSSPPGPEAVAELDWRMMLLLRESLHQRRGRSRREPRERGRERVGWWVVGGCSGGVLAPRGAVAVMAELSNAPLSKLPSERHVTTRD